MKKCLDDSCQEHSIFLEDYCWQHLRNEQQEAYPQRLFNHVSTHSLVESENLRCVRINGIMFPEFVQFLNCDFRGADIEDCIFKNGNFQQCDFRGADIRDCIFKNGNFQQSNFSSYNDDTGKRQTVVKNCHFENGDFRNEKTTFAGSDVKENHFNAALLQNVDFTNADLRDSIFTDADMIGAKLSGAILYCSRFLNTRFSKKNLCNFKHFPDRKIKIRDEIDIENPQKPTPLEAVHVYALLKNNFRSIGDSESERWARKKERIMERKRLFRLVFNKDLGCDSLRQEQWPKENKIIESRLKAFFKWFLLRWPSTIVGYGESPSAFLVISSMIIVICAFLLLFFGFHYENCPVGYCQSFQSFFSVQCLQDFMKAIYASLLTFSSLGSIDVLPIGISKGVAVIEAILGIFCLSGFVTAFTRYLSEK